MNSLHLIVKINFSLYILVKLFLSMYIQSTYNRPGKKYASILTVII